MKVEAKKDEFIRLRLEGLSYDKIAKKIDVSKQTLINWNAKYKMEIEQLKLIKYDELLWQYKEIGKAKFERLLKIKKKILDELEKRDLKDVKTVDLILLANKLDDKIDKIKEGIKCDTDEIEIGDYGIENVKLKLD